ncbi:MAG: hypothetical protein KDD42_07325 [Bdellovibrionales bacterium]|nr:hypothetical protein [Bdellovibrionales bacterium]
MTVAEENPQPLLNSQLIELDRMNGSDATSEDFVFALISTLQNYEGTVRHADLVREMLVLHDMMLDCRPRMANMILDVQKALLFLKDHSDATPDTLIAHMNSVLSIKKERLSSMAQHVIEIFQSKKKVLLHSSGRTMQYLIGYLAEKNVKPEVFVASQEPRKTKRLINSLHENGYEYSVVSEHAIAHVIEYLDLALFGCLTLNRENQLIMQPGSSSLISQMHDSKVPIYVFLTTNKFSFWAEATEPAYREIRPKKLDNIRYEKIVFSHDTVPLELATGLITEEGVLTPQEARNIFARQRDKYLDREAMIRALREG